jgi:hypothetical protein
VGLIVAAIGWKFPVLRQLLPAVILKYITTIQRTDVSTLLGLKFSRAAATIQLRVIDPRRPITWEFCGFSEHGEDGVVDYLSRQLVAPNRFFVEIGAGDGAQNCTAWLAFARSYGGIWVEGKPDRCKRARMAIEGRALNVHVIEKYVCVDNLESLMKMCPHGDPDVVGLDIDGIDWHVGRRLLTLGYRPRIWVVEYNSVYGPEKAVTVPLLPDFDRWFQHPSGLYYGCSISAWRNLFHEYGYVFVTVESSGTNAFFIDPAAFPPTFAEKLCGEEFRDNETDLNQATRPIDRGGSYTLKPRDWRVQYPLIAHLPLVEV